jgi:hypothetical protein
MTYQCNLCKRCFSRKTDLAQHYNQLHLHLKHSYTLDWIQNQQKLDSVSQISSSQIFNNNIWNEIEGLGNFSQVEVRYHLFRIFINKFSNF